MIKQKVLAFPGWGTNATIMQFQMGSLHDYLSQYIDIEYVDPPYPVLRAELPEEYQKFIDENQSLFRWGDKTLNFHADLQNIQQRLKEDQNIVGFIGFSQGTILEQLIAQIAMNNPTLRQQIKFMIFFSANGIKMPKQYYDQIKLIQIPSLHTIGNKDWLKTESLIQTTEFLNPILIYTDAKSQYLVLKNKKLYFNLLKIVQQSIKVNYEKIYDNHIYICIYVQLYYYYYYYYLLKIMIHDLENQQLLQQVCQSCLHITLSTKPLGIVSEFDPIFQTVFSVENNIISSCRDCATSRFVTLRQLTKIYIYQLRYCSKHKIYKINTNCDTCSKILKQDNYYQCVKCFNYYNIQFLHNQQCPICYQQKCQQCQQSEELYQQQSDCIRHNKNNLYRHCAIYVYFTIYFFIFLLLAIYQLFRKLFKEVIQNLSQIETQTNMCIVFIYYPILLLSQIIYLVLASTFLIIPYTIDYLIRKYKEIRTSFLETGFYTFNVNQN